MSNGAGDVIKVPESMLGLSKELGYIPSPQQALKMFATPVRVPLARKEQTVCDSATLFDFECGSEMLRGYKWGTGSRRILLMHGWNGRALNLSSFIEPLVENGFTVIGFDAPGHGDSGGEICYAPKFAAGAIQLAETFGDFYGIVAHSFGTCSATVAQIHGLKLQKAIYLSSMCWIKMRFFEFAAAVGLNQKGQQQMWELSESYFGLGVIESFHGDVAAKQFESKGLIFHDQDDREILVEQSRALAESWPDGELVVTEGLGHFRIIRSKLVIERAVEFLK